MDESSSSQSIASVDVIVRPDVRPKSYSLTPNIPTNRNGSIRYHFNECDHISLDHANNNGTYTRKLDTLPKSAPQSPSLRRALRREHGSASARIRDAIFKVKPKPCRRVSDGQCPSRVGCESFVTSDDYSDVTGPLLYRSRKDLKAFPPSISDQKISNETLLNNLREYEECVQMSKKLATEPQPDLTSPLEDRNPVTIKKREMLLAIGLLICISVAFGLILVMMLNKLETYLAEVPKIKNTQPQCLDTKECLKHASDMLDMMNNSTRPCADFYKYACGGWINSHDIPVHTSSWSVSKDIQETANLRLKAILEQSHSQAENVNSPLWKARTMYLKCQDDDNREESFQYLLSHIPEFGNFLTGGWSESAWSLDTLLAELHWKWNTMLYFTVWVAPDDKAPKHMIIQFDQGGLNLHHKGYYADETNPIAMAYKDHINTSMLGLGASVEHATRVTQNAFGFEKALAEIHYEISLEQQENVFYHKMNISMLQQLAPSINWSVFLRVGFPSYVAPNMSVLITKREYFERLSALVDSTPKQKLNDYMLWSLIHKYARDLPDPVAKSAVQFENYFNNRENSEPRWQHCASVASEWFSDAVSEAYANKYLPSNHRKQTSIVADEIRATFAERLQNSQCMLSKQTRFDALNKLNSLDMIIGYPNFILSQEHMDHTYRYFDVKPTNSYLEILLNGRKNDLSIMRWQLENNNNFERLHISIHNPEAFYDPVHNKLHIQAGMLQSPHFVPNLPSSFTFGAIGSILAHEMLHGFDTRGGQADWWSPESYAVYTNKSSCLESHYNGYKYDGLHINGSRTLDENMADLHGLKLAFDAYQLHEKKHGKGTVLPGLQLNNNQTFFLSFAQNFCSKRTSEDMRRIIKGGLHAPDKYRVIGVLRNMLEFAEAFNCSTGAYMNPQKRCDFDGF